MLLLFFDRVAAAIWAPYLLYLPYASWWGYQLWRINTSQPSRLMGQNADAFDFLLGEWEIAMLVMPEGTTVGRRAKSHVHRILDGAALFDEIRHFDEEEQVNFRGASFRTYVPESDSWYVVWMMANVEGYSTLRAEVVDGELRTTGRGRDSGGELIEQGLYYDTSSDGYSFTLDRSYDAGKTWIRPFVSFRATRPRR